MNGYDETSAIGVDPYGSLTRADVFRLAETARTRHGAPRSRSRPRTRREPTAPVRRESRRLRRLGG